MTERKKIAAIITEYRPVSHADVLVGKFLQGFPIDEGLLPPRVEVASMYIDQFPEQDMGRRMAAEHGVPLYPSIVKALTLGGGELAVDGVLLVGEHGDYAWNEKEQHLFPRRYFMEQIGAVMATSGRGVPVFNDKHLSYSWRDAKWMYDRARDLGAPFMAGSSLPVCWRAPFLEHALDTPIHEAVAVGFSGLDIYGFHTLEVLQCMVERRAGGETGVAAVTCLEGESVWQLGRSGAWWRELAEAACSTIPDRPDGTMEEHCTNPALFVLEYRDGLRGAVLMLNGYITSLAYAARGGRAGGQVEATEFHCHGHGGADSPHAHFSYLGLNIEEMFVTGTPAYPVERTLLTSGVLEAALTSRYEAHRRIQTPWLDTTYRSFDGKLWRPAGTRPSGACLDPWPPAKARDQRGGGGSGVMLSGFGDEIAAAPDEQIAVLQANQVRYVELRGVGGKGVLDLSPEEVRAFRADLDAAGIAVSAIGSPIGKVSIRSDLDEHYRRFKVAVERARQFGTRYVRLFSFYHGEETAEAAREAVIDQLKRMVRHAEQAGIILLHENESGIYGDVPERCLDLLQAVRSPHFRATFDPANFIQCGVSSMVQAWELLEPHVEYFHIKDAMAATGGVVPAGYGDGELDQVLTKAREAGFSGFLSLEPHLKADDPVHGGDGAERFGKAVSALRAVLARQSIAETR